MKAFSLAALVVAGIFAGLGSASAQYAPWPPPPGMSAGEYAARYGHLIHPREQYGNPGWDRRRPIRREDWRRRRHYEDDDDDY